jgi:curved DNA-binding protein CbpA
MRLGKELLSADLYGLLELPEGATREQIKRAWRRLAITSHPYLAAGVRQSAEQRMAQINVAASVLLDADRRALYDRYRRAERARHVAANQRPFWPPAREPEPEWEQPAPLRRSFFPSSAELAGLLQKLRPVSGRVVLGLSEAVNGWPPRRHAVAFAVCVVMALWLIGHARPRSLAFLYDKPPTLGVASPKGS